MYSSNIGRKPDFSAMQCNIICYLDMTKYVRIIWGTLVYSEYSLSPHSVPLSGPNPRCSSNWLPRLHIILCTFHRLCRIQQSIGSFIDYRLLSSKIIAHRRDPSPMQRRLRTVCNDQARSIKR